jgi:hypothetical protein
MDPLTPSKEQRKLLQKRVQEQQQSGSVKLHQAASAYDFGGVPKTPHTSSKKKNIEETPTSTTTSSSSSSGDELNLSMLSDTTELTASNFVFAASARQRWAALQNTTANHNKLALSKASTSKDSNNNHILLSPPYKMTHQPQYPHQLHLLCSSSSSNSFYCQRHYIIQQPPHPYLLLQLP